MSVEQDVAAIREAIYGREVREAIADGIEKCYADSTANAQMARIQEKADEVIASIPGDYTALSNDVSDMTEVNAYNLLTHLSKTSRTHNGITWAWNGSRVSISGTATALENNNIYSSYSALPPGFVAGSTYYVNYHSTDGVLFRVYVYNSSSGAGDSLFSSTEGGKFTIPSDTIGLIIRLTVLSGSEINETVYPIISPAMSNQELANRIDQSDEEFDALEDDFHLYTGASNSFNANLFENGGINDQGAESTYRANARARTKEVMYAEYSINIASKDGFSFCCYFYTDSTGSEFINVRGWFTNSDFTIPKGSYYKILIRDPSNDASSSRNTPEQLLGHIFVKVMHNGTIIERNPEAGEMLVSLKRHFHDLRDGSSARRLNHNNLFAIAHTSDVHLDTIRYQHFIDFCNYYSNYINAKICTGDFINQPFDEQINHMKNVESTKTVLYCVGNHERNGAVPLYDGGPTGLTRQETYTKWGLAQWYTDTGVTPGSEDYPLYYYKDFTNSDSVAGYSIRLIVLNCCDYGRESSVSSKIPRYSTPQLTWLVETLQSAADSGKAVIVAQHYNESPIIEPPDTSFFTRPQVIGTETPDIPIVENIIDAFRNGTTYSVTNAKIGSDDTFTVTVNADFTQHRGQFLAWIVGHAHRDRIGYSERHPDQLILSVVDGCYERTDGGEINDMTNNSDLPRIPGNKSEDAFNVYAFDPVNKLCKVMRVGADLTDMMVSRKYACFETEPNIS